MKNYSGIYFCLFYYFRSLSLFGIYLTLTRGRVSHIPNVQVKSGEWQLYHPKSSGAFFSFVHDFVLFCFAVFFSLSCRATRTFDHRTLLLSVINNILRKMTARAHALSGLQ